VDGGINGCARFKLIDVVEGRRRSSPHAILSPRASVSCGDFQTIFDATAPRARSADPTESTRVETKIQAAISRRALISG